MRRCTTPHLAPLTVAIALGFVAAHASAASFDIQGASTTAQTLGSAAGQTGNIGAAGSLTLGGGTNAVAVTGNNATLTNLGSIIQSGTGRAIRDNTGVTGLVVTNGSASNHNALIQTAAGDVIQMNVAGGSVTLNNYGRMVSLNGTTTGVAAGGSQVVDFNAITTGANTVNNYAGASMVAYEADAVRPGVNGTVYNAGLIQSITTTGSSSDGVDAQTNSGIQITNDGAGQIIGGRHGITGGAVDANASFAMLVTNNAGATISGSNGSGINIDGFNGKELVTVINGGLIVGNGVTGDGDGVDVDGLVNITNLAGGIIRSTNAVDSTGLAYSEGISVGGGTITNSGLIEGLVKAGNTNAVGRGITLVGNDVAGSTTGAREALYGNATVVNMAGGVIRGQTDSAIVVGGPASGYTVSITNNAGGLIQGGGKTAAAIQTGFDNDTLINGGTIDGSSSGKAIDLGAGNNTLKIVGGSAVVLGNISGGVGGVNTMTIDPGTGNAFSYAGSISNFASVAVQSGTVTLSGVNSYSGVTQVNGGTLVLAGANRVSALSALNLAGGTLALSGVSAANGQTFAALVLTSNSAIDLGGSSITFGSLGPISNGAKLAITGYTLANSPTYALRVLGDYSADASFGALLAGTTLNGAAASYTFDGTYTDVTFAAAVPEPSSVALMLAGFGLVGAVARRRRA